MTQLKQQLVLNDPSGAQSVKNEDFIIIGHIEHAFIYKFSQLGMIVDHIKTNTDTRLEQLKKYYQLRPSLCNDGNNLNGAIDSWHRINSEEKKTLSDTKSDHYKRVKDKVDSYVKWCKHRRIDVHTTSVLDVHFNMLKELNNKPYALQKYLTFRANQQLNNATADKSPRELQQAYYLTQHIFRAVQVYDTMDVDGVDIRQFVVNQRKLLFSKLGKLSIDCETYTLEKNGDGDKQTYGNQVPWCVTVYGNARSLNMSIESALIPVRETFTGEDCMNKLV